MLKRLVKYFSNSSIHGLHYITDPKRHISERIFWATICTACLVGTAVFLQGNIENFECNAVSFVMETNYLKWNTSFPAISVCEIESSDKLFDSGTRMYGRDRNMNMDFYLRDIAFYYGTCYTCSAHCGKTINCSLDYDYIVDEVRAPCPELIGDCLFNGKPFPCCHHFKKLTTEKGPCYTINSIHVKKTPHISPLDMTSNISTPLGKLEFKAFEKVEVFIHAPEDVPFLNHPQTEKERVAWGNILEMSFKIKEIENDPNVKDVSVSQRSCRFPQENNLRAYKLYSYSTCILDCRAQAQIKYCNCIHHLMPKMEGVPICNLTGLICLFNFTETLRSLRTADYTQKQGLVCDCIPSCSAAEYTIVSTVKEINKEYNETIYGQFGSKIVIQLDSLPKERFKRKVVRSSLELVVSMGGTIGFFLGASLLSIAEFFYYFFIRKMMKQNKKVNERNVKNVNLMKRKVKIINVMSQYNNKKVQFAA